MPVYTDKRNGRFFIQFRLHGETYKERLPVGTTKKQAEALEIKVKSQMLFEQHGIDVERKDFTFERFVQDYYLPHVEANTPASLEKALIICKAALAFLKGRQMRSIKPFDIERFKASRMTLKTQHGTQRKPATVLRELCVISGIFSLAVKNDVIEYNPCSRVQKPKFDNVQDRILKREDEQKFFANMYSEWAKDICTIVLNTGLRQNDVMRMTRFEVDLNAGWLRITQGKTSRRVEAFINDAIRPILEKRIEKYKDGLLFPSPITGNEKGSIRHCMLRACKRAKIDPLTIRDLRRTYGTRLQENGVDTATVARMLGHSDLRSIHRYQRSLEMMQKASESLASSANILPAAQSK
jgi:integrase